MFLFRRTRHQRDELFLNLLYRTWRSTMSNQDAINELTAQLHKVHAEVVARVDELEAALAAGEELDLSGLRAAVQGLDDLNPDEVEEPVEPTE